MFTEGVREIFMEGAEQHGWLDDFEIRRLKTVAEKLLMLGDSPEKVADATELPIDIVIEVANKMKEIPVV